MNLIFFHFKSIDDNIHNTQGKNKQIQLTSHSKIKSWMLVGKYTTLNGSIENQQILEIIFQGGFERRNYEPTDL